jgi:hypothetical protein
MLFKMIRGDRWNLAVSLLGAALVLGGLAPQAKAQSVAVAEVDGHVQDPSGSAIAGATVKMTEIDKHQVRTATTDTTGRYAMPNLPIGAYRLDVTAPGFKTYVQTGIVLEVASNIELPVTMTIGAVTDSVTVTANAGMVETKDSSIGQVVNSQAIDDLPLNGRNPTQLLLNTGYVMTNMTLNGGDLTGSKNIQGSNGSGQFSVAGGAANGVNYLLDGGDNNDAFSNVNLPIPFPDAIEEFNVQTSGLPAQYGLHPGGVVNIVTKSGANSFHGDLFEFFRNGDLNSRPKGDQYGSQPIRDSLKRNQFGGTAGGRIIKDKLFFFGGYQGTRQHSDPADSTAYVPTAATLNGDFSVVDGAKANGGCLATAKVLKNAQGTPYPNNQIPVSTFDAAGLKLATTYLPTSTNPCGTYLYGFLANNPDNQWIGRIDYVVSDHQNFYARYYIYDFTALSLFDGHNSLTTGTPGNMDRSQTMTIGDTYTFSGGNKVNSFHATYDRRRDNRASASNMFSPKDVGVNMFINISDYTQLSVTGYSGGGFNIGCGTCALANFDINTYQLADDFTIIKGKHQIQVGFDGRKDQFNSYNYQQANGQFTFNGTTTGDGLADLLIGRFSGLTDGNVISDYLRQTVVGAYAQDAIHVSRNFSVNVGLRWEPSVPSYDKYGRGNQFSFPLFLENWHSTEYPTAPAGLIFSGDKAQDPNGDAFTASHWATFSPRLGMVWDPKGDGKQTIRAAFVLIHDTTELFYPERWTTNAPYVSSISLASGQFSSPFSAYTSPNGVSGDPFPGNVVFPGQGAYISVPPNMKVTYMMQWNLSYQRQVAHNWLLSATYMGNAGRHIWGSTDINYSVPTIAGATASNANNRRLAYLANPAQGQYYADIQQTDDGGNSEYHSLLVSAKHSLSHGVFLQVNYNWSHCESSWDFAGELAGPVYQNPLNRESGEYGNCGYDHRQNFILTLAATSPGIGPHMVKAVTEGWQLSPIVNFQTGNPIQLSDGGKDISLSAQLLDRPEVLTTQVYGSPKTLGDYFNATSFACNGSLPGQCTVFSGQFGNLGRNSVYGPGTIQWDMALDRKFRIKESLKMDFRADFFNIMNHANWSNPVTSITSSTFGQITGFGSPRIIQMAVKLLF